MNLEPDNLSSYDVLLSDERYAATIVHPDVIFAHWPILYLHLGSHSLSPFLRAQRKVTQRRAPGENPLRHAWSSSVHFGNSPCGLRHPKCLTLGLGRLPRFSHGTALRTSEKASRSLFFKRPLHPVSSTAHKHAPAVMASAITKPGRHDRARFPGRGEVLRCSNRYVTLTNNACLRGLRTGVQKKNRILTHAPSSQSVRLTPSPHPTIMDFQS